MHVCVCVCAYLFSLPRVIDMAGLSNAHYSIASMLAHAHISACEGSDE